jgi:hypothetical protein
MNAQLSRGSVDRVGRVDMGVADQLPARDAGQQMHRRSVAPVAYVQHDVLGERIRAIGVPGRPGQLENVRDIGWGESIRTDDLE